MTGRAPRFTVVMRTGRSPELLPHGVASVLAQTEESFELLMIGGGVDGSGSRPELTADPRVRWVEGDRAAALCEARGTFVAEARDEALWFPDHLLELGALLEDVAFGHLLHVELDPDGSISLTAGDLAEAGVRDRMLTTRWSCVDASSAGYRLEAYRRLPAEPSPPAPDVPADLALWRRFLTAPDVTVGTRFAVESITLVAAYRNDPEARATEGAAVVAQVGHDRGRRELRSRAFASWHADCAATQAALDVTVSELQAVYRSRGEISAQAGEYARSRAALAEQNAELAARLAEQDARLAAQDAQLAEHAARLADRTAKLTEQRAQVARLRSQVTRLRARCARLRTRNDHLRTELAAATPWYRRVARRLRRRLRRP